MPVKREFWGWERPIAELAVAALTARAASGGAGGNSTADPGLASISPLDLSRLLVVVPTRAAGRRLRERLAAWAAARGTGVFPPHLIQPGGLLTRRAAVRPQPFAAVASAEEMLLAFTDVLRGRTPAEFPHLLPKNTGGGALEFTAALAVAEKLCELRQLLGDRGLDFAEVPAALEQNLEGDVDRWEPARWGDLERIEHLYLERLARAGLADPNCVRRAAAAEPCLPEGVAEIIVLAVPDPLPLALDALARLAARGVPVTIGVHAPPELHEQFDEWGRPVAKLWLNRQVEIADVEIRLVGQPADAADAVAAWMAQADAAAADTAVGVPDEAIVPPLRQACATHGWPLFDPAGKPLEAHAATLLLRTLAELRVTGSFAALSTLLRHPDLLHYLRGTLGYFELAALLTAADTCQNEHLPESLQECMDWRDGGAVAGANAAGSAGPTGSPAVVPAAPAATPLFAAVVAEVARLVGKIGGELDGLAGVMQEIYAGRRLQPAVAADGEFAEAAGALMERLAVLESPLAAACVSGAERLELLRRALLGARYYPDPEPVDAVTAQGWLELPWDDAPHLALTGFNEGFVPDSVVGHAFLPDSARAALGLPHNEQRFVRDTYLLSAMLAWRRLRGGRVLVTLCKTDAAREPLRPSRLLFLCEDGRLATRAQQLFGKLPEAPVPPPRTLAWKLRPRRKTPEKMSVTDFKAYLDCPVHYHLQRNLRMSPLDDRRQELDAAAFGSLCHEVLREFAAAPAAVRDSASEEVIRRFVEEQTEALLRVRYGTRLPAALLFQRAALQQRLAHFARVQAAHRAAGWRIARAEFALEGFELDGMPVRGRIDRLDIHDADGRALVLDYKTSDTAETPEKTHLKSLTAARAAETAAFAMLEVNGKLMRWNDLQLPLYLLALQRGWPTANHDLHVPGGSPSPVGTGVPPVSVVQPRCYSAAIATGPFLSGYFSLPKAVTETQVAIWSPEPELVAAAERCAQGIIAAVRAGADWPPGGKWDAEFDVLAAALVPAGFTPEECFDAKALSAPDGGEGAGGQ